MKITYKVLGVVILSIMVRVWIEVGMTLYAAWPNR